MNENEWNGPKGNIKMNENGSKSPKINGIIKNRDKPVVQNEANGPKWIIKMNENRSKSLKIIQS